MRFSRLIGVYFLLTCLFSWSVFILLALNHHQVIYLFPDNPSHARTQDVWHAIGGLGPAFGAVMTMLLFKEKGFLRQFYLSFSWKKMSGLAWFLALSPVLYLAIGICVDWIISHEWFSLRDFFQRNDLTTLFPLIAWLLPSIAYGFGEEPGWRGFLLPLLQKKYSAFIASTILSGFWVVWHIPSFWYRYDLNFGMLIGLILGIWAGALLLTYIFNTTRGSLLAVCIWHFTWDVVSMIGKEGIIAAIMSTLIMALAVLIVLRYKGRNLSPLERITFQE